MGRHAYLIVTDLHMSYKNLRNRQNYFNETDFVTGQMITVAKKYKELGWDVKLLLLGDVFHNSYNDVFRACHDNNFFMLWNRAFGEIYSVIGNHELTYYSSNPFYTLVNKITSEKVQSVVNRVWRPVSKAGVIQVPDLLEDGEVVFHFNHNGTPFERPEPDGRVHVGLFHHSLVCRQILSAMESQLGRTIFENTVDIEGTGLFHGYAYCFFGHMHTVYGTFAADDGTILCYLASLGRTNVAEVQDNFLERNIPVMCVEDGRLCCADDNLFYLPARADCVKEASVAECSRTYQLQKECRKMKQYEPLRDDPVANVKDALKEDRAALQIFCDLLTDSMDSLSCELSQEYNNCCKTVYF